MLEERLRHFFYDWTVLRIQLDDTMDLELPHGSLAATRGYPPKYLQRRYLSELHRLTSLAPEIRSQASEYRDCSKLGFEPLSNDLLRCINENVRIN